MIWLLSFFYLMVLLKNNVNSHEYCQNVEKLCIYNNAFSVLPITKEQQEKIVKSVNELRSEAIEGEQKDISHIKDWQKKYLLSKAHSLTAIVRFRKLKKKLRFDLSFLEMGYQFSLLSTISCKPM